MDLSINEAERALENAQRAYADELVRIAKACSYPLQHLFPDPSVQLQPFYGQMRPDDIKLFAQAGAKISESVAQYLVPQICKARTFDERLQLGQFYDYWRVWRMIIRVPGLDLAEIRQVQQIANNFDVTPW